jgi:hypothetical protein
VILLLPLLSHTIITLSVSRTATNTTVSHTMTESTTSIPITTMIIYHVIMAINAAHANTTIIFRDAITDWTVAVRPRRPGLSVIRSRTGIAVIPVVNTIPIRTVRNTITSLRHTIQIRLSIIRPRKDLLCIRSRSIETSIVY